MRKLLYILLILPSFITIGHDVYFFVQKPERGFMMSDLGFLWDKYHKDSHDQWKNELSKIGENVDALTDQISQTTGIDIKKEVEERKILPQYADDVTIGAEKGKDATVTTSPHVASQDDKSKNNSPFIKWTGFILKQKAALIFFLFTLTIYLIEMIFRLFFSLFRRKDKFDDYERGSNRKKDGAYKYGRK